MTVTTRRTRLFGLGRGFALQILFDLVAFENLGDMAHSSTPASRCRDRSVG